MSTPDVTLVWDVAIWLKLGRSPPDRSLFIASSTKMSDDKYGRGSFAPPVRDVEIFWTSMD
ncbi:hypothetical protein ED21_23288 [Erythrobacter sp. SD-21]|nr:hypothetical protein ED21_23288 [Erythrobacter sp. SD-21]